MRTWLQCAALAAATAALGLLAYGIHRATAPAVAALQNLELASARAAALIGEPETDGKPFTVARLVATTDATVAAARPVLSEAARTARAARQPLSEAAETIRAARPVLGAAERAIDRTEPVLAAATATVERGGKAADAVAGAASNASASWDDLYWDVKAAVASGTVAARGVAEASEAIGKAAPVIAESAARVAPVVADNAAAITTDARKVVHRMASPLSTVLSALKKLKDWIL